MPKTKDLQTSLMIQTGLKEDYRFISDVKDMVIVQKDKEIMRLECRISGLLLREGLRN